MAGNMSNEHHEGVGFAGLQVEELQAIIAQAKEKLENEVLGLIVTAVGEPARTEAGANALAFASGLVDRLEEAIGICEATKAELNRYAGGF